MRLSSLFLHTFALCVVSDVFRTNPQGFVVVAAAAAAEEEETASVVPPQEAEKFEFEAEVHRMLDIVVNSLYQHNEVFLRELISNASDALDKLRFWSFTEPKKYKSTSGDEEIELKVEIEFDAEQQTLSIRDTGIGMTKQDLISNLGTVARSGTTKFIEALKEKGSAAESMDQIGQFGVGFYSSFLVANRITVASKHPTEDTQHVWESQNGSGDFMVYPDPRGNTLPRGTEITLHLKEDSLEYADETRIRMLARHYSEFVQYPISLRTTQTEEVEIEDEDAEDSKPDEEKKSEDDNDDDDLEVGEEADADAEEEKPKKTKQVTTYSWERLNGNQAIWTREKDTIKEEEYDAFFQTIADEKSSKPASYTHFIAEGNINFKSILYLPDKVPMHYQMGQMDKVDGAMKLYVRRVLISDSFDLLPKYLGFIRGVVDSDDLPLNVNRESLQESKILQVIKKKVVKKAIEMIKTFASESDKEEAEVELDEEGNPVDSGEPTNKYLEWYQKFAPNIKMGAIDDEANRAKLCKLLRFETNKSGGKMISLDAYIENMKEWQKDIYVLGGTSVEEVAASPFLEIAAEKDVEVLYLTDAIDEYMVKSVMDYKNNKFKHLSSEGVKFKDESEDLVLRREKVYKKKLEPLVKYLKKLYQGSVLRIQVAKRPLGSSPAIVASSDFGNSANMERIMKAQAFQAGMDNMGFGSMKVMEINPRHPLILKLLEGCPPPDDDDFEVSKDTIENAWLIHDMAMLNGGFPITHPRAHNKRLMKVLKERYQLDSLDLEPEIDPPEDDGDEPDDDEDIGLGGLNMEDFGNIDIDDLDDMM